LILVEDGRKKFGKNAKNLRKTKKIMIYFCSGIWPPKPGYQIFLKTGEKGGLNTYLA
jgi:hypothetical protein